MTRQQIITEIKRYFKIDELVCNHIYDKWKDASWQFLDTDFLHVLLVLRRDILKAPMICNNVAMKQRGLRCNRCDIVRNKKSVYMSAHVLGKGGDFTVKGMTAEDARKKIKANAHLLPCDIRIERGVSWLHFDTRPQTGLSIRVYEFNA